MTTLKEIMIAFLNKFDGSLYNAALTKLVYLFDIEHLYKYDLQASSVKWVRDSYGPFVWDIYQTAEKNHDIFKINIVQGEKYNKNLISLKNKDFVSLDKKINYLVDKVFIEVPNPKHNFIEFRDYVYSTAPMVVSEGLGPLELEESVSTEKEIEEIFIEMDSPEWHEGMEWLAAH